MSTGSGRVLGRFQLRPLTSASVKLGCLGRTLLLIGYHVEHRSSSGLVQGVLLCLAQAASQA